MKKFFAALFSVAVLGVGMPVYAQFDLGMFTTNLSIAVSPTYPAPQAPVHLTLQGSGIDLSSATIVWRAGGAIIAQGVGKESADIIAGTLGSQTAIEADITGSDGSVFSAQASVAPTELDILVASDSYTPPFYLGRALPSAGTDLILQALPHFERADGSFIASSDITYTWKQDGQVLGSLSGRGRSSLVLPIQHLYGGNTITLDAVSSDGTRAGETTITVPLTQPVLDLYEDHPLYGVLYNAALSANTAIPEDEMAFAAVPYFAEASNTNDPMLLYAWTVNGSSVPTASGDESELTINAQNSSGAAQISLEVTHATNFYLDAKGGWNILFSKASGGQNPFAPQP